MAKKDFAFGKENFILIAGAVVLIIIGFILMSGGGSGDNTFNPAIFDNSSYCDGDWLYSRSVWYPEEE